MIIPPPLAASAASFPVSQPSMIAPASSTGVSGHGFKCPVLAPGRLGPLQRALKAAQRDSTSGLVGDDASGRETGGSMRRQLSNRDPQPADRSHEVWALATTCGYVMGADSMCPSISRARVAVTADRMSEMLALYPHGTRSARPHLKKHSPTGKRQSRVARWTRAPPSKRFARSNECSGNSAREAELLDELIE